MASKIVISHQNEVNSEGKTTYARLNPKSYKFEIDLQSMELEQIKPQILQI